MAEKLTALGWIKIVTGVPRGGVDLPTSGGYASAANVPGGVVLHRYFGNASDSGCMCFIPGVVVEDSTLPLRELPTGLPDGDVVGGDVGITPGLRVVASVAADDDDDAAVARIVALEGGDDSDIDFNDDERKPA